MTDFIKKLIFFLIMVTLLFITTFVPWILVIVYQSKLWYLTVIPLLIIFLVVWVKGFEYIL